MSPIALFAYHRPKHLEQTLEALFRSDGFRLEQLVIYCDGPKGEDPDVEATRRVARGSGARVVERPANWGFGNLTRGVSEMCGEQGQVIVLEDDHIVSPDFLPFMEESLARYAEEERVWVVNGYMYPGSQPEAPTSFFLPSAFPWGWATWQRAWRNFCWRPPSWRRLRRSRRFRRGFDFDGEWRISRWVCDAMEGRLAAWDPQWAYLLYEAGALGLFPAKPLVWNSGLASGVHGEILAPDIEKLTPTFHGEDSVEDFRNPQLGSWSFPEKIEVDRSAYAHMAQFFRKERRLASCSE